MQKETENPLETLTEIRSLMERSSRFLSLSGLSGICSGIFALLGAGVAWWYLEIELLSNTYQQIRVLDLFVARKNELLLFFFIDAFLVLFFSLACGVYFSTQKAKKNGWKMWDKTTFRLLENLMIPLATGGLFCLILLYHGIIDLIAPCTLIFYGLALVNGSKYTLGEVRYLGICEIILGLLAATMAGYGLLFWAIGFGFLHIIYGTLMYLKNG